MHRISSAGLSHSALLIVLRFTSRRRFTSATNKNLCTAATGHVQSTGNYSRPDADKLRINVRRATIKMIYFRRPHSHKVPPSPEQERSPSARCYIYDHSHINHKLCTRLVTPSPSARQTDCALILTPNVTAICLHPIESCLCLKHSALLCFALLSWVTLISHETHPRCIHHRDDAMPRRPSIRLNSKSTTTTNVAVRGEE